MKEVYMCRPCAEKLKTDGKVKIGASVKEKQTCSVCNRRRFVYLCTYKRLSVGKSDKYIICYTQRITYHGKPFEDIKFVFDSKGNFKEYSSKKRAEAAAQKRFKDNPSIVRYEICRKEGD